MSETYYKPYTIGELVTSIWEENDSHFEEMEKVSGDCDCSLHTAVTIIMKYWGE
jgi:hypothetical protein